MMYLSKGILIENPKSRENCISLHGKLYALGPRLTAMWSRAHKGPKEVPHEEEGAIQRMEQAGLVVTTEKSGMLAAYELLSQCVLCPDWGVGRRFPLWRRDQRLWKWLSRAGLRLTASELVRLEERRLVPSPSLLGEENRQALTEMIYTADTIHPGALEAAMESSPARDLTAASLMRLLRRRYLFLA